MAEQTMRIDDALSRSVLAIEKGAAALERIANVLENQRKDADAVRGQLEQTTRQLERGLQMVTALVASVAGAVDQAADAKSDESDEEEDDEGQRPQPVADEAPAKPEPAAKAEPAAAPVEVKQDEDEKPAAKTEAPKPEAPTPEVKAEQAEPMDLNTFREAFLNLTRKYGSDRVREATGPVLKRFNIARLSVCAPAERAAVISALKAELGEGA